VKEIQANQKLTAELNGLTNQDAKGVQDSLQATADIAGKDGGLTGDLRLYNNNLDTKGYAYTDTEGDNTIGVNTRTTDLTKSGDVINTVFHETTNKEQHSDPTNNDRTAKNRGNTAEAIWDLKNFGNENTNAKTTTNAAWNNAQAKSTVMQTGNATAKSNFTKAANGDGTVNMLGIDLKPTFSAPPQDLTPKARSLNKNSSEPVVVKNTQKMVDEVDSAAVNAADNVQKGDLRAAAKDAKMAAELATGTAVGYASGDMFDKQGNLIPANLGEKQVLFVNGILTDDQGVKQSVQAIKNISAQNGESVNMNAATNKTHGIILDLIQSAGYTVGAKDITAVSAADAIDKLAVNGNVSVYAHSQGAAATSNALDLVQYRGATNTTTISYQGFGGQQVIMKEQYNLNSAVNYADKKDLVPYLGNALTPSAMRNIVPVDNSKTFLNHEFAKKTGKDSNTGKDVYLGYVNQVGR
jgi:hypothetical protein